MQNYHNYISLDLETTGLEPQICDITEIAMIKVRDGEIVDRFETFVFTPLEISQHVSYLTGITAKDIENAPDFIDLKDQVKEFIGDDPLMGHNIWFDWNFLTQKGLKLDNNPLWDTYTMSNILYPELPSHSLETNSKYFGISHEDSHRAMADVMACYELWKILMDSFPEISADQAKKIQELQSKSSWPLLPFFLQDKVAKKHRLEISETSVYHPEQLEAEDISDRQENLFIHCRGVDPIDAAMSLKTGKKTLYIAGYPHTLLKLQQAFPEAMMLNPPFAYLSASKLEEMWQQKDLEDAQSTFLLKTILHPSMTSKDELILSHPERGIWKDLQTDQEQSTNPDNAYQLAYQQSLKASKVITSHYHALTDLEYVKHFDQIVILEPQLLEDNASRCFGSVMTSEQWMQQSQDENWVRQGELLFSQIDQLGNKLVPTSQYPEHVTLTELILQSNEFIRLKSAIKEIHSSSTDESLLVYLKYYQAFFQSQDPSWVRWFTVDPRRGVRLNIMPLSVKTLLNKHLFQKLPGIVISETADQFHFLPEMESLDLSKKTNISVELPDLEDISGGSRDGDHQALISYLSSLLPQMKGKTAVIFSSKTALKRYFFDLAKVISPDISMLGEDVSGGTGKLRDRYLSAEQENKVIFMSYRNMRSFPAEVLDFDNILLQSLPFDPPGLPIHQARSAQVPNAFMDYAVPRTQLNLLEIVSNFTKRDGEKKLTILDRRTQEKAYGEDLLETLK